MELKGSTDTPPRNLQLEGPHIILKPLRTEDDFEELYDASHGTAEKEAVWTWMFSGPFQSKEEFKKHLQSIEESNWVPFVVVDKKSNQKVGIINYLNIVPAHRTIEIGGIWYTPSFHRTYVNTEASYLTIKYAFEELKYRRMEWKTNSLNQKSRDAALRLGFTFEGIFRQHMIIKGKNRDTAWFSIIDSEWPEKKKILEEMINRK